MTIQNRSAAPASGNGHLLPMRRKRPPAKPAFLDPRTFPDIYGLSVAGDCMAPAFTDGCKIKVSKSEAYSYGEVVVVWLRPEFIKPGCQAAMLKRVRMMPPPWVKDFPYKEHPKSEVRSLLMLGRDDRPKEMFAVPCVEILAIHKCLGLLEPRESVSSGQGEA